MLDLNLNLPVYSKATHNFSNLEKLVDRKNLPIKNSYVAHHFNAAE